MITLQVQHSCGCCFSDVQFESEESANLALQKAGLGSSQTLIDDTGKIFEDVDTFYGFVESKNDPLSRLLSNVLGE